MTEFINIRNFVCSRLEKPTCWQNICCLIWGQKPRSLELPNDDYKAKKEEKVKRFCPVLCRYNDLLLSDICHGRHSGMPLELIIGVKKVKGFPWRDNLE
jgi:hypothetical protein